MLLKMTAVVNFKSAAYYLVILSKYNVTFVNNAMLFNKQNINKEY